MTPTTLTIASLVIVTTLASCGTTYVDTSVTVPETGPTTTTTLAPIAPDAPLGEVLAEIKLQLSDLDEKIIDQHGQTAALARIDELWTVADSQIRDRNPDDVIGFQQSIELAHSGVERLRPADASKAYKIWVAVLAEYTAR